MIDQRVTRRQMLALGAVGGLTTLLASGGLAGASGRAQGALHVVAHQDDSLLFLNPDQRADLRSPRPVQTVFLTAGESIFGTSYWMTRELGVLAGLANLAGVPNDWSTSTVVVRGTPLDIRQLSPRPAVTVIFMRLPDGNVDGSGFPASGNQSLQALWQGSIGSIDAVDGSASYTKASLVSMLAAILTAFQPSVVRTQDFVNTFGGGDHSDHYAAGAFVQAANAAYAGRRRELIAYLGYPSASLPANVLGRQLRARQDAWLAYAPDDPVVPQSIAAADATHYGLWLARQYRTGRSVS